MRHVTCQKHGLLTATSLASVASRLRKSVTVLIIGIPGHTTTATISLREAKPIIQRLFHPVPEKQKDPVHRLERQKQTIVFRLKPVHNWANVCSQT